MTIKDIAVTAINTLLKTSLTWERILSILIAETFGNLSIIFAKISLDGMSDFKVPTYS